MVTTGTESSRAGFAAKHYRNNLVYGTWFFADDNSKFLFQPNDSEINKLLPGESVTSTLSVSVFEGAGTTNVLDAPVTISYTIKVPLVELSWDTGTTGVIEKNSTLAMYNDLQGSVSRVNLPTGNEFDISITEVKNDEDP